MNYSGTYIFLFAGIGDSRKKLRMSGRKLSGGQFKK
jgi:hypothetical protein